MNKNIVRYNKELQRSSLIKKLIQDRRRLVLPKGRVQNYIFIRKK